MNREMVKPMPASAAPPPSCLWVRPGGSSAQGVRAASAAPSSTPTSLPSTRPAITPQVSREVAAAASESAERETPAFASANNGSTSNAMNGRSSTCRRSFIATEPLIWRRASSSDSALGLCRNARVTTSTRSTASRFGGYTGRISAIATPASVACTPDWYTAIQVSTPTARYTLSRRTCSQRNSPTTARPSPPSANQPHDSESV